MRPRPRPLARLRPAALIALLSAAPAWATSPFPWRGVVEGFYGPPWSHEDRLAVLAFMGPRHLNVYVYAPKGDTLQREAWAEPYPQDALDRFAELAAAGDAAGVTMIYSLSPGQPIGGGDPEASVCYACPEDRALVAAKLESLLAAGFAGIMLSFDDVVPHLVHPEDVAAYGDDLALAQADLSNATAATLEASWPDLPVWLVPTQYKGTEPSPYLGSLGAALDPRAEILWTGPAVLSATITRADALAYGAAVGRPPLIWDNYPVNDGPMAAELHLGPLTGRDPELGGAVTGLVANPMVQAQPSLLPLATIADYLWDPLRYDADASLERALASLGGPAAPALASFALQCQHSPLDPTDAVALGDAVDAALRAYPTPGWMGPAQAVAAELALQRDALTALPETLPWPGFLAQSAPWWTRFGLNLDAADAALSLLTLERPRVRAQAARAGGVITVTGAAAGCDEVLIDAARDATAAGWDAARSVRAQVHGAQVAFYYRVPPGTLVIGENVAQDLVEGALDRDRRWRPRSEGCDRVAVTVDGTPTAVSPSGAFTAALPDQGQGEAVVRATDGAGYVTEIVAPVTPVDARRAREDR